MKNIFTILACVFILGIGFKANSHSFSTERMQKDPPLPARVVSQFETLVNELVTQNFGEVSFDMDLTWTFQQGKWVVDGTVIVTRSTGLIIHAAYRMNGTRVELEYSLL